VRHDPIADRKRLYLFPDFFDDSTKLVSHYQWGYASGTLVFECLEFTAADATGSDSQEDLVPSDKWLRKRGDLKAFIFGIEQCPHRHLYNDLASDLME